MGYPQLLCSDPNGTLDQGWQAQVAGPLAHLGARLKAAKPPPKSRLNRSGPIAPTPLLHAAAAQPQRKRGGPAVTDDGVSAVVREIEAEPNVARVEEAQFWQVHYGLCMANLKVCVVSGCDDGALSQLRSRISRVIQNRLGEGYGRGSSLRWEVTLQTSTDSRS
ncbi:cation efflux family protein family [Magnaporthiopsis poae ATCC 64411]|uniref:Cation efflux family protein family n=1 Tax=Magnaporthiopsis poae (strain ATCC 64411 / 73-15) TaxID=644358 RepID=A0A0C4DWL3_MAGP6|nr:cation efflux family protein family [Magnaporthiopsis poae ATCC 64411]